MAEFAKTFQAAAQNVPTSADLRPLLEQAAAAGGRAAVRSRKSVSSHIGSAGPVRLTFSGPGAAVARKAAQSYVEKNLPVAAERLRATMIRSLEA